MWTTHVQSLFSKLCLYHLTASICIHVYKYTYTHIALEVNVEELFTKMLKLILVYGSQNFLAWATPSLSKPGHPYLKKKEVKKEKDYDE